MTSPLNLPLTENERAILEDALDLYSDLDTAETYKDEVVTLLTKVRAMREEVKR